MSSQEQTGGMDVRVHPLVVMSVADHYTQHVAQYKIKTVYGALMGVQRGLQLHVYDIIPIAGQDGKLDLKSFDEDMKLYKQAFPQNECLGWYTTGNQQLPGHMQIHRTMATFTERPIFLLLDPQCADDAKELPVKVFEEQVTTSDEKTKSEFIPTPYKIESDESERITAVHCSKVVVDDNQGSPISPHIEDVKKAVRALQERTKILHTFLRDVSQGKITPDPKILRAIKSVCNRLPTLDSQQFHSDFLSEYNDALLVTLLATVTKGDHMISEVITKFNSVFGLPGGKKGGRSVMAAGPMMPMFGPGHHHMATRRQFGKGAY